jgi:hypothetical protein
MSLATLLEWWNFVFALPLAVGGVLLLGLALSGMIDLGGDHANGDADHAGELHGDGGTPTMLMSTRTPTMQATPSTPRARTASMASSKPPTAATTTTPLPRNRSGSRR